MTPIRNTLLATALMTLSAAALAQNAPATTTTAQSQIPAQPLIQALNTFASQTGLQLMYVSEIAEGCQSKGSPGGLSAADTLRRLLEGTNLTFEFLNDKTVAIRAGRDGKGGGKTLGTGPAGQMRMADMGATEGPSGAAASTGADGKDQITVQGDREKVKPYKDGNADIPRTISDAQPYYIFDARTINSSGAINIEDFLKQRLTMNTLAQANGDMANNSLLLMGNTSTVDLRGLGYDKTLILINGRRSAGVRTTQSDNYYQPDLNGIPVSAIERIEVLPSSASGIYGGSAIGGVVNVILKRDYVGGAVRINYDDTWDNASPNRKAEASYGMSFEGGRTHVTLGASWSDAQPLVLQDRADLFTSTLQGILARSPTFVSTTNWIGSVPNITTSAASLTLRDGGGSLNSKITHVPAGTTSGTPPATLATQLRDNAGLWNRDFAPTTQPPTGLLRPFGTAPEARSVRAGVRRQMTDWLELSADFSFSENTAHSLYNPITTISVPSYLPTQFNPAGYPNVINPFNEAVTVMMPDATQRSLNSVSQSRIASLGAQMQLPGGWTSLLDYTWSQSRYSYEYFNADTTALNADITSGRLNVFVDNLAYPIDFMKYATSTAYGGSNEMHAISLRGSGPLPSLPWGQPRLTAGLEYRLGITPDRTQTIDWPLTPANSSITTYYKREQITTAAYMETAVPLVKEDWLPGMHSLELQVSGRSERFKNDIGTNFRRYMYLAPVPSTTYFPATRAGDPYFSTATYTSSNYTVGLKYQPVKDVILRASRATAFLPPTPTQLLKNPETSASQNTAVLDPTKPVGSQNSLVYTIGGGNPDLTPQNSRSFNAGIIWQPGMARLSGLRVNAEYYRIEQFDAIGSLTLQQIVDQEATYPDRVTRDANGNLYLVDNSQMNLYHRETEGMDFSLDYALETSRGRFSLHGVETVVLHLKSQPSLTQPQTDAVRFPSEGGAPKYKSNAALTWEGGNWTSSWTTRYVSSYKQYGSAGGPSATLAASGVGSAFYSTAQGSGSIPSQMYHDLVIGYSFDGAQPAARAGRQSLAQEITSGVALQLGVRNVFGKAPPVDTYYNYGYYLSPFGDIRLRSYWLNLSKTF